MHHFFRGIASFLLISGILVVNTSLSQNTVQFQGQITAPNSDSVVISSRSFKQVLYLDDNHKFSGDLAIKKSGFYSIYDGTESASIYLEKGFDLALSLDTKEFDETIQLKGKGAELSNFFFQKYLDEESGVYPRMKSMDSLTFSAFKDSIQSTYTSQLKALSLSKSEEKAGLERINQTIKGIQRNFEFMLKLKALDQLIGKPLGEYSFVSVNGDSVNTKDLTGKAIYIDVWATWCGPCVGEIPALKELEDEYGEHIHFVSISVDKGSDREKWKNMVKDKELKGFQLIADNAWSSDFVKAYSIFAIPRFILVDSKGNVISANAPRPSSGDSIREELDQLK